MKKFLGLLSFMFVFISCTDETNEIPEPTPNSSDITILAYLVANNNLDGMLLDNIVSMYDGLAEMKQPAT